MLADSYINVHSACLPVSEEKQIHLLVLLEVVEQNDLQQQLLSPDDEGRKI